MAKTDMQTGGSLSSKEAATELLSLVLVGKDVSLVGPGAADQESALRGIDLLAGVGRSGSKKAAWLQSSVSLLMNGAQLLAGSWRLPCPSIAVPGLHLQSRKCLSLRGSLKRAPLRSRAKVLQLSAKG